MRSGGLRDRLRLYRETWQAARSVREALRFFALYAAMRAWSVLMNWFPVEANLRTARLLGNIWWLVMKRHRDRAMDNLRPALGHRFSEQELRRIARRSFEHFAQVFLVELVMTPRLITAWSWARYVELRELGPALRLLLERRGTIMLTAHFGNFELLGFVISRLGLPLHAVMRPLDNPLLNDFLVSSRQAGGLSLLFKRGASAAFTDVLRAGGTLCFIADQDAGKKGVFADFFGRKASWYKSIALLAIHEQVPIVVGAAPRIGPGFRYEIGVERIIRPAEWAEQPDPVLWITEQFAAGLEAEIGRFPEQYLWVHRRWKTRPREEAEGPIKSG